MINYITKIVVKHNKKTVGYLAELSETAIAFQYDSGWLEEGFSLSPFSLPLNNKVFYNSKPIFNGLFGVFHDSMPDGWGEILLRRFLAKKGYDYDQLSPIIKLTLIGENGLGGLIYEPSQSTNTTCEEYDLDTLALDIETVLSESGAEIDLDLLFRLGGSSGGARPKVHLQINSEHWIVKFPCVIDKPSIGIEEYNANILAKKCGINANSCRLFPSNIYPSGLFGAQRFDRKGEQRTHVISLSAILETSHRIPNLDYIHLFQVIDKISIDKGDSLEAFRRMCFNVFYGNKDDHGKNISFFYDEDLKGYRLSPAYDITRTPYKREHEMTVFGNGIPNEKDILAVAKYLKLPLKACKDIMDKTKAILFSGDF